MFPGSVIWFVSNTGKIIRFGYGFCDAINAECMSGNFANTSVTCLFEIGVWPICFGGLRGTLRLLFERQAHDETLQKHI